MNDINYSRPSLLPPGIKNLLIINGLFYLATILLKNKIDLENLFAMHYWTSPLFHWWQPLTHMFMHDSHNIMHIIANMYALWMFGVMLENVWGTKRFLFFYFVCGFGAMLLQTFVDGIEIHHLYAMVSQFSMHPTPETFKDVYDNYGYLVQDEANKESFNNIMVSLFNIPHDSELIGKANSFLQELYSAKLNGGDIGASGAVMGVLLAFGMLFPNTALYMFFIPIPIKAKYFVAGYALFELYAGFSHTESGVAHFAHLGGMLFGLILILYWNKTKRNSFY